VPAVRNVLDFYRQRPLVAVVVVLIGLAVAVATLSVRPGDGVVLPIFFVAVMGVVVGSVIGWSQRRRER
jgi:NhaP-type Na+/H+ or K+/H+ antiporter